MRTSKPQNKSCPTDATLRDFLAFELHDGETTQAEEHLSICDQCQDRLEVISAGATMWTEARQMLRDDTGSLSTHMGSRTAPFFDHFADDYLKSILGPTDDPQMLGRIGCYEISGVIGHGGTGIVLKAFDAKLNRYVAIKVLAPGFASNASARTRFEREGKAVAAVSHDHVVPVHAVDEYRGLPYLVMQYVPGKSLQQRIDDDGPLQTKEIVRIGMQVAQALACAHAQGVIHRDVKPANILLENGVERVRVTDFGLAQVADDVSVTRTGVIAGTPQYMSPEQTHGERLDGRSDLFSLGAILYACCTGRPPFRAETTMAVLRLVAKAKARPVLQINSDVPIWLAEIIHRLLEKNPADRFDSADDVAILLGQWLAHIQQPDVVAPPTQSKSFLHRSPTVVATLLTTFAGLLIGIVLLLVSMFGGATSNGDANQELPSSDSSSPNELSLALTDGVDMPDAMPTDLRDAVAEFNVNATTYLRSEVGESFKPLPKPLTVEEVLRRVGDWDGRKPPHLGGQSVPKTTRAIYRNIADTATLPPHSQLEFDARWVRSDQLEHFGLEEADSGSEYQIWVVYLAVMTGKNTGYRFALRTQRIRRRDVVRAAEDVSADSTQASREESNAADSNLEDEEFPEAFRYFQQRNDPLDDDFELLLRQGQDVLSEAESFLETPYTKQIVEPKN